MTNKLTKNDRLMSQSEKHDVAVATFEAFLKKHRVHKKYFDGFRSHHKCNDESDIFSVWKEWAREVSSVSWMNSAFIWRRTDKGYDFWSKLSTKWIKVCMRNLK